MIEIEKHTFHIPVMGLSYTVDTPIKIARFGITSVVSIIQDQLLEQMREFHSNRAGLNYEYISKNEKDYRSKRITSYLNMMHDIVENQMKQLRYETFEEGSDIVRYFELLPESSDIKKVYIDMLHLKGSEKKKLQDELRQEITPGKIDVNIMTKVDNLNRDDKGDVLPVEYADAMTALRGYAQSKLHSSLVLSAGLNPRLYSYLSQFEDFFPDESAYIKKKVILKVGDYRSALIQGKFLAKKGIWVSEFRIESGLNCGGHAFPSEGKLLGPILEEFKSRKNEMIDELYQLYNHSLQTQNRNVFSNRPLTRITVQGGIGTSEEDKFLREHYDLDGTGWGSPFLMVPEVTNVDDKTLKEFSNSKKQDFYLSYASPLGIPFNNFRKSSSEKQRKDRIEKGRPGSPCYLKHLTFNTEFNSEKAICTASREYQFLKLKELNDKKFDDERMQLEKQKILEKDCLCHGLSSTALIKNHMPAPHKLEAVTICPGPNLAYFSNVLSLDQLVGHIYGRLNVLDVKNRPHLFINELSIHFNFLKEEIRRNSYDISEKQKKFYHIFKMNLLDGLEYYQNYFSNFFMNTKNSNQWLKEIKEIKNQIIEYCESASYKNVLA